MKKMINTNNKITKSENKSVKTNNDPVTKAIPYFAVTLFIGLVLVVAYDYFMVIR